MTTKQSDELSDLAAEIILDAVRNEPWLPFHRDDFHHPDGCKASLEDHLLVGCTPVVEEAIGEHELRLGAEWPSEDLASLLEVLCDEITRKTPFLLKRVKWTSYSREQSRIHVSQAAPTEFMVAAQVQQWLAAQGTTRTQAEVIQAIRGLGEVKPGDSSQG